MPNCRICGVKLSADYSSIGLCSKHVDYIDEMLDDSIEADTCVDQQSFFFMDDEEDE